MRYRAPVLLLALLAFLCVPWAAAAQGQAVPTSKLGWDQDAPTLADAQAYTYRYYADGATTGVAFPAVACTGSASPFVCTATFPAFTPGNHTLTVTAGNAAGESAQSTPLAFVFVVTPSTPGNVRIVSGN